MSETVTRPGDSETVTPSQSVMADPVSQFNDSLPAYSSRIFNRTRQSATRPGLVLGSDTAVPLSQAFRNGPPWLEQRRSPNSQPPWRRRNVDTHLANALCEVSRISDRRGTILSPAGVADGGYSYLYFCQIQRSFQLYSAHARLNRLHPSLRRREYTYAYSEDMSLSSRQIVSLNRCNG